MSPAIQKNIPNQQQNGGVMDNYGLIVKQLRLLNQLTLKNAAKKIGKSEGWLCEIENNRGLSRIKLHEFDRIVKTLNGQKHKELFKTWVAIEKNKEKVDRTFDGAVLKYIREQKGLTLKTASVKTQLSKSYLTNLENGFRPVTLELRNKIMVAYGYSPSSFKNLSTDEKRSKAVPAAYRINVLMKKLQEHDLQEVLEVMKKMISRSQKSSFLTELEMENKKEK